MTTQTTPITETNHFIVLDKYDKIEQVGSYQTESEMEKELIADLVAQGYEYRTDLNTHDKLLANVRAQLQKLNNTTFTDSEWHRFVAEYLDKPSEHMIEKLVSCMMTVLMILCLIMGVSKIFICWIR